MRVLSYRPVLQSSFASQLLKKKQATKPKAATDAVKEVKDRSKAAKKSTTVRAAGGASIPKNQKFAPARTAGSRR